MVPSTIENQLKIFPKSILSDDEKGVMNVQIRREVRIAICVFGWLFTASRGLRVGSRRKKYLWKEGMRDEKRSVVCNFLGDPMLKLFK